VGHKTGSNLRPWFQFYAADFTASTITFTDEQCGAYLRLLNFQWLNGDVPIDDADAMVMIAKSWPKHSAKLAPKFPDGRNPRLELIRDAMLEQAEKNTARARKAAAARHGRTLEPTDDGELSGTGSGDAPQHPAPSSAPSNALSTPPSTAPSMPLKPRPTPTPTQKLKPRPTPTGSGGPISESMWDAFRATYPERQGTQGWSKAKVKAAKLVASGVGWADIMSGARRYRDQQQAAGKIGTEFIKRAEFFLAADAGLWTEDYPISQTNERTSKNVAAAKRFIDAG
jgi:uncharacterized protein YdaU (DUF1376 family)